MRLNKLKGILREHDDSQAKLAKALNISRSAVSYKLNGKTEFTMREANIIKERYSLSITDMEQIFFDE